MSDIGTHVLTVGQYVRIQERGGFERDSEYQDCPSHEFRVPGTRITLVRRGGPSSYAVTCVEEPRMTTMTNEEQLNTLRSGVAQWNAWREQNPAAKVDLSGSDLRYADLDGANLSGANLSGANLSGACIYKANLSGANLSWADLSGADLSDATLTGAALSGANLIGADISGANIFSADLDGANLTGAIMEATNAAQ